MALIDHRRPTDAQALPDSVYAMLKAALLGTLLCTLASTTAVAGPEPLPCTLVHAAGSLEEAQALARAATPTSHCVEVSLEGRAYTLADTLALTAADSNVSWIGVAGKTEITSAVDIPATAWGRAPPSPAAAVLEVDARGLIGSGAAGTTASGTQPRFGLLVELAGTWRPLTPARWPNLPFEYPHSPPTNWSSVASLPNTSCGADCRSFRWGAGENRPARWAAAAAEHRLFLHGFFKYLWRDVRVQVTGVDAATRTFSTNGSISSSGVAPGGVWYAYNLKEELDVPGEYVLDEISGKVAAILPPQCVDSSGAVICRTRLVPSTATWPLVSVTGGANIRIAGVALSGSLSVGISVYGGDSIAIEDCKMHNLQSGVVVDTGSARVSLRGSEVGFTAASATSWSGGNRTTLQPSGHLVENNRLHDFGRWIYTYQPGAFINGGVGTVVRKNEFHSSYHVAILFSGNNHLFELNEFHHVTTVTYDSGAIYAGRDLSCRGSVIRHNLFRDLDDGIAPSPCNNYTSCIRQAVYIDDFESGVTIAGNIFFRVPTGFFSNCGSDFTFTNNMFVQVGIPIRQSGAGRFRPGPPDGVDGLFNKLQVVPFRDPTWAAAYPRLAARFCGWETATEPPVNSSVPMGNVLALNAVVNASGPSAWQRAHSFVVNADGMFSLAEPWYDAGHPEFFNLSNNLKTPNPGFVSSDPAGTMNFSLLPSSLLFKMGWASIPQLNIGPDAAGASSRVVDVSSSEWLADATPLLPPPPGHGGHDAAAQEVAWGAALFLHGRVTASVDAFTLATQWNNSVNGTLWQRGCAMFYTEQLAEAAAQFAFDVTGNPNDTEESVWHWLCQARAQGVPYAAAHLLITTGETRPYMVAVYSLYRDSSTAAEQRVLALCSNAGTQEGFYAHLYYGLWAEAHGRLSTAEAHLRSAGLSAYGATSGDYMWWLARVHNAVRGWPLTTN